MNGVWYRFDDAVVHEITLQQTYNVNLIMYRREDEADYIAPADLSHIPKLSRSVVLNRKAATEKDTNMNDSKNTSSSRPPLITPDTKNTPTARNDFLLNAEHPTRHQPPRARKQYAVYYGLDSESSEEETSIDKTHSDSEYTPQKSWGTLHCKLLFRIFEGITQLCDMYVLS